MLISEVYISRQGEGRLAGTPSVFVRTSGCNLRCGFCDTPFASWEPEGEHISVDDLVDRVVSKSTEPLPAKANDQEDLLTESARHVVLTGGEPMLPKDSVSLCEQLSDAGFHITIETAGTIDRNLSCDLMSISPKLQNSTPSFERAGKWVARHEKTRHRPDIVAALINRYRWQLKFVVASRSDVDEIEEYLNEVTTHLGSNKLERENVLLMPEGIDDQTLASRAGWMVPLCEQRGFTFCQRQHVFWYGNRRGT